MKKKLVMLLTIISTMLYSTQVFASNPINTLSAQTIEKTQINELPSHRSTVISMIDPYERVSILYIDDTWAFIEYKEFYGYVDVSILTTKDYKPAPIEPKQSNVDSTQPLTNDTYDKTLSDVVEYTPWTEAKNIFKIGQAAKVYDVLSGKTYYVKSFSNGNHADVEPITKEDTKIMFETFDHRWSWDVRPVWVTIGGKTMAASINGMPHAKGVNDDNGMDGQVCIHFNGSKTHNGNQSYTQLHQEIALEAYNLFLKN